MNYQIDLKEIYRVTDRPVAMIAPLAGAVINALMDGDNADLLLESVTLDELVHAYVGHELVSDRDTAMFEAISTTRSALARSMLAFIRKLNQGLNSAGIKAGQTSDAAQEDGGIGGAEISKVRKVAGIPILIARIPLSDGQSISLVFHSPTSNGTTITGSDTLTVFRFLLNKRDVTHVVAPQGGMDITLAQVTQYLVRLIEQNSGKFARQQNIAKRTRDELATSEADAANIEAQQLALTAQVESMTTQADQEEAGVTDFQAQISKAVSTTAKLEKQRDTRQAYLDDLKAEKRMQEITWTKGQAFTEGYNRAATGVAMPDLEGMPEELLTALKQGADQYEAEKAHWLKIYGTLDDFKPNPNPTVTPITTDDITVTKTETEEELREREKQRDLDTGKQTPDKPITDAPPKIFDAAAWKRLGKFLEKYFEVEDSTAEHTEQDEEGLTTNTYNGVYWLYQLGNDSEPDYVLTHDKQDTFSLKTIGGQVMATGVDLKSIKDVVKNLPKAETDEEQPDVDTSSEVVASGIAYMNDLLNLKTDSLDVLREARGKLRGVYTDLTAADQYSGDNEDLFNRAARHLADLMAAIAQRGK